MGSVLVGVAKTSESSRSVQAVEQAGPREPARRAIGFLHVGLYPVSLTAARSITVRTFRVALMSAKGLPSMMVKSVSVPAARADRLDARRSTAIAALASGTLPAVSMRFPRSRTSVRSGAAGARSEGDESDQRANRSLRRVSSG
jgi:hypothetical protein